MYGDYRTFKVDSGSQSFVGILSSYNWRNTPLGIWSSWHKYQDGTFHLPGVRPRTFVRTLQPYFRTQRELGDRALVCDTFSKGCAYDGLGRRVVPDICPTNYSEPIAKSREVAGFGFKHHRKGYFVLYGDGRAQWFGDPDRKIIWHTQGQDTRSFVGAWYVTELCNNYFYGSNFGNTTGYTIEQYYQCHGPNDVWHQMDVAAGVDVNVKYW
jgi:hypothetical protein